MKKKNLIKCVFLDIIIIILNLFNFTIINTFYYNKNNFYKFKNN